MHGCTATVASPNGSIGGGSALAAHLWGIPGGIPALPLRTWGSPLLRMSLRMRGPPSGPSTSGRNSLSAVPGGWRQEGSVIR